MIHNISRGSNCPANEIVARSDAQAKDEEIAKLISSKLRSLATGLPSLVPLRIVKYLSANYLEIFIKTAMEALHGERYRNRRRKELITASLNSVHALSVIFLGLNQAKQTWKDIGCLSNIELGIVLPSGNEWKYKVHDLLHGSSVSRIHRDLPFRTLNKEQQEAKVREYILPSINKFFEYLQPFVNKSLEEKNDEAIIQKFEHFLSTIDYKFNNEVIDSLENEILENSSDVNPSASFLYWVAGVTNKDYSHVFTIEQFYCEEMDENRFIVYQSQFNKGTLFQWMEQYAVSGIHSLSLHKLLDFLSNLEKIYCQESGLGTSFPLFYKNRELTGISLRYTSAKISPQDCLHHLTDLIDRSPQFKIQFAEQDQVSQLINFIKSKIFINNTPLAPFRMIKYLTLHDWDNFMAAALRTFHKDEKCEREVSSCIATSYVVSKLLLGKTCAHMLRKTIRVRYSFNWNTRLPSGQKTKTICKIKNLFSGDLLWELNKEKKNAFLDRKQEDQRMSGLLTPYAEKFFKYTQPKIAAINLKIENKEISEEEGIRKLENFCNKLKYKFNSGIIEKLKKEVTDNHSQVNENNSFLYFVGAVSNKRFDHAFILEHYWSPLLGSARIRLYQSWISQRTLPEEMKRRGYKGGDEGTWDLQDFYAFSLDLQEVYEPNENRSPASYVKCFGHEGNFKPLISLNKKKDRSTLSGINLRYISLPFCPADCYQNLAELMQSIDHENELEQILKS